MFAYHLLFHGRLGVLPLELNKLLIIIVVLSMALTPLLNEAGRKASEFISEKYKTEDVCSNFKASLQYLMFDLHSTGPELSSHLLLL